MKIKLWLLLFYCGSFIKINAASDHPFLVNLLPQEVEEIINADEQYAYFGELVSSLVHDLPFLRESIHENDNSYDAFNNLCDYIAQKKTTAPVQLIKDALTEASEILALNKASLNQEDGTRLSHNLDKYYTQLVTGKFDVIENPDQDFDDDATRSVKSKTVCQLTVKEKLTAGCLAVLRNACILGNLTVNGNETIRGNLTVEGLISTLAPSFVGSLNLIGAPEQACIIFRDASLNEKARICSSSIPGDNGVFVSVDGGATQNVRVNTFGGLVVAAPTSGAAITATGQGTTVDPALTLIDNPASAPTDFLLTINPAGVVTESTTPIGTGFIINGCQTGPITIGSKTNRIGTRNAGNSCVIASKEVTSPCLKYTHIRCACIRSAKFNQAI